MQPSFAFARKPYARPILNTCRNVDRKHGVGRDVAYSVASSALRVAVHLATAAASLASSRDRELHLGGLAGIGFFESDFHVVPQVNATRRGGAAARLACLALRLRADICGRFRSLALLLRARLAGLPLPRPVPAEEL